MTEQEKIQKAIRYMKCIKDDAKIVLADGFGTHVGESTLVYDNRIMYAEIAIKALEKQIPKKPIILGTMGMEIDDTRSCPSCKHSLCAYEGENYCMNCGQRLLLE